MIIEYGNDSSYMNITDLVLKPSKTFITIPSSDHDRNVMFGDPVPNQIKHIRIRHHDITTIFHIGEEVILYYFTDMKNNTIKYGMDYQYMVVTEIVYSYCLHHELMILPADDNSRTIYFGDPMVGLQKQIVINDNVHPINTRINIYIPKSIILRAIMAGLLPFYLCRLSEATQHLYNQHLRLQFYGGNIKNSYELQLMVYLFLHPHNIVLELEAGLGQVSLTISQILTSSKNLVTFECKDNIANALTINRDLNNLYFHIEIGTLSPDLMALKGRDIIKYDHINTHNVSRWCRLVKSINLTQLKSKYGMEFDTLVAGNIYNLLKSSPNILSTITMIILHNDYYELEHKKEVEFILNVYHFTCIYSKKGGFGPCSDSFYEVWTR